MTGRWAELAGVGIIVVLALLATKLPPARAGVAVAIVAGLAFSGMGVATRTLEVPEQWWLLFQDPDAYAVLLYGAVGTFMFASALQRASVTTVSALVFGLETIVPSFIGIVLLGDSARACGRWRSLVS